MRILTGGCSFSAIKDPKKLAWPFFLKGKGLEIFNTAEMASGNEIILDRLCAYINKEKFDYVIVMWSNPYRYQFFLNREIPEYNSIHSQLLEKREKDKFNAHSNFVLSGESSPHPDSNWIRVGGGYGKWKFDIEYLDSLNDNFLTNFFNFEYQFIQTCKSIVTLQSLCKSLGVKLINTSWQNIWDDLYSFENGMIGSNWITVNTVNQLINGEISYVPVIDKYPNAVHWYNLIDWGTWVFYENDKVKRGGLGEFSVFENNDYIKGISHPSSESQRLWSEYIFSYLN